MKRSRSSSQVSLGLIIFILFTLYVLYNVGSSFVRKKIQIYEVGEISSAVKDLEYRGLILRDETVYKADRSGYVNYYIQQGSRAAVGNIVCAIDENGTYVPADHTGTDSVSTLSEGQLESLKKRLAAYAAGYDPAGFFGVYSVKMTTQNMLLNYINAGALAEMDSGESSPFLTRMLAPRSGIVEYYCDGLEGRQEKDLTKADFDNSHYEARTVAAGAQVKQDDFVYKVLNSEVWDVYISLSEEDIEELSGITSIDVHFNDVNLDATAEFSLVTLPKENKVVGRLRLSDYMIQLADRRYTSVTLLRSRLPGHGTKGLKIPKSAVLTKDVYVIPEAFSTVGDNDSKRGFILASADPESELAQFVTPSIYALLDGYYYVNMSGFAEGAVLLQPAAAQTQIRELGEDHRADESSESEGASAGEEEATSGEAGEETTQEETLKRVLAFLPEDYMGGEKESSGSPEEAEESSPEPEADTEETAAVLPDGGTSTGDPSSTEPAPDPDAQDPDNILAVNRPDTQGSYKIGQTANIQGVLNINKGYCVFRHITILEETDDYYIVEAGDEYGIAVYDHILLDASAAAEGDIIYQ